MKMQQINVLILKYFSAWKYINLNFLISKDLIFQNVKICIFLYEMLFFVMFYTKNKYMSSCSKI